LVYYQNRRPWCDFELTLNRMNRTTIMRSVTLHTFFADSTTKKLLRPNK